MTRPWRRVTTSIALAMAGGALLATAAGRLGAYNHYLDLLAHFTPYFFLVAILCAAFLMVQRQWLAALITALCGMPAFLLVAPMYFSPAAAISVERPRVSVAAVNVYAARIDYAAFSDFARAWRPDVLCLSEINPGWATALEALRDIYPHQVLHPRKGNFGIALLSRFPIANATVHRLGPDRPDLRELAPCIEAEIDLNGQIVTVMAIHVYAPFTPRSTAFRDQQLDQFGAVIARIDGPLIVAGDLNLTPWSPRYRARIAAWKLRQARDGRGMLPTWPARFPMLPIDHILLRGNTVVTRLWRGPDIGSDHLPLLAEVSLSEIP